MSNNTYSRVWFWQTTRTILLMICASFAAATTVVHDRNKILFFEIIDSQSDEKSLDSQNLYERIEALSQVLLGTPYMYGSLGEGARGKYDQDPLIRFDVFDCTTYVEAVIAGALSRSSKDFLQNLINLRYKNGEISFINRNHFPSSDWIPNNKNVLEDITNRVALDALAIAHTVIDKPAWYASMDVKRLSCSDDGSDECTHLHKQLMEEGKASHTQAVMTPYVPLSALYLDDAQTGNQALLNRIPSGSLINMVRPNWQLKEMIGTHMNVSHQAIAIRKNGELFLRHASQTSREVVEENLLEYFSQYSESSSLKGFNVLVVKTSGL